MLKTTQTSFLSVALCVFLCLLSHVPSQAHFLSVCVRCCVWLWGKQQPTDTVLVLGDLQPSPVYFCGYDFVFPWLCLSLTASFCQCVCSAGAERFLFQLFNVCSSLPCCLNRFTSFSSALVPFSAYVFFFFLPPISLHINGQNVDSNGDSVCVFSFHRFHKLCS